MFLSFTINKARWTDMEIYVCRHCRGASQIVVVRETEKATEPVIEFCPFCGMSNHYHVEIEEDSPWKKD